MSKEARAHLAVLVVNLIYGANFNIAKAIMPAYIGPLGFIVLRVFVSLFLFFLFFLFTPFFKREKIKREDILMLALCGLTGVAVNQMLFFKGLALTSPINGAIIMTTNPILVLIIAAILIKERVTITKMLGIAAGAAGALTLLLWGRDVSFHSETFTGDLFIFINAMSYGVFLVISKPLLRKYNPVTVIKWTFFFGSFMVLPFGYGEVMQVPWSSLTPMLWAGIAYVVIATTFIAYLLNTIALDTLSPSSVSIYIYLQPLFTTVVALFSGNQPVTPVHIVSALLIFAGVYLVSRSAPGAKA